MQIDGDRIKVGSLFSTKMACMAEGVMAQESRFLNLLQAAERGEIRADGALVIATGDGTTLVFRDGAS
jgi:heat shock protein HslJ